MPKNYWSRREPAVGIGKKEERKEGEKGAKSMFYRLPESYATWTDVAVAWISVCVIFGCFFLLETYL